ncbi:YbgA family protein [Staphylococcus saprophyticus]|uniref:DUF1722 domain-containing protein n=3 Tax=Staphylococcus TaxID=1279 RepID=Q4A0Z6_STAS1|nr:YbgA family protein [Staphylococcus saprophyticus]OOC96857.1 type II DNA modification enzyme [Staphylococcus saprophyticus subsp. saprophyticus ATCC 15305 = NCTC 7292]MBN6764605.1 YbgA family protein [Staphylococcus saprophyticus]MBN6779586.1 YbgA family protein [Staphylococcus saprophyticus]MDW3937877.1 YbgA family protein [Staphylococcus saprophyticus]MDW3960233.1 YbgA family protein [Staphylococcus saprophyticus]
MSIIKHRHEMELLWKAYKYEVMWHSQQSYNEIREMLKGQCEYRDVEEAIDHALSIQPSKGSVINTFSHIWGYFKKFCSASEKALFKKLKAQYLLDRIDTHTLIFFIYCMTRYYDVTYLKESTLIKNFSIANKSFK